jgi:hypothetical protein
VQSHAVCLCLRTPTPFNFWMPEPIFMKLGIYITAPAPISTAYFINPSHQSVFLYVYPLSLLSNGSEETLQRQRRIVGSVVFYWVRFVSIIRDKSIFSSERMLHKDYYRKGSVAKKNLWSWVSRGLTPRQTDWRSTTSRKVTLTFTSPSQNFLSKISKVG